MVKVDQELSIVKADAASAAGAKLNLFALGDFAQVLAGSTNRDIINKTFEWLWRGRSNRFSHHHAFEAKRNGSTIGLVTCYPVPLLNRLAWPTLTALLSFRKLKLIGYHLLHPQDFYSAVTLKEGHEDEFHIGTLATMPESRGLGVGSRLIAYAEEQAVKHGFSKSSLTVKKENHKALQLYERMGYRITGEVNKPSIGLYRMAKRLL